MRNLPEINDAFRDRCIRICKVNRMDMFTEMEDLPYEIAKLIDIIDGLGKSLRSAQAAMDRQYTKALREVKTGDIVYSERDSEKMAKQNVEYLAAKDIVDNISADIDFVTEIKENLKSKQYMIRNIIDYEKFRAGE